MARIKLQSPWQRYYDELEAFFGEDSGVRIVFDEDEMEIKLFIGMKEKAEALEKMLPAEKVFGNITLKITVVPGNDECTLLLDDPIRYAFLENPIVSYIKTIRGIFSNPIIFVVFRNEVVQYFNDDLFDVNGNCSTLYQDIAERLFENNDSIYFCTDMKDGCVNLGEPYCEWP